MTSYDVVSVRYEETQRFRQEWLWALLVISAIPAGVVGVVAVVTDAGTNSGPWVGIVLATVVGPLVVVYDANLRIEGRDDALLLRLWPLHLRPRRVSCDGITRVTVVELSPLSDFGGVGVRVRPSVDRWGVRFDGPVGYVVEGRRGVRIERDEGADLVVTASDPRALVRAIERAGGVGGES